MDPRFGPRIPSSPLMNANKRPEIRAFSYYVAVDLGKIGQSGEGSVDETR